MKTWFTSNLRFGSLDHMTNPLNPRYNIATKENIDNILVANINSVVDIDDVLIVVGNLIEDDSGAGYLPWLKCRNKICIGSKKDDNFSGYIKPYFEFVEDFVRFGDITVSYDYDFCKCITHNLHNSICGSPWDAWKYNENSTNVSIDVWNYMPVELDTLKLRF